MSQELGYYKKAVEFSRLLWQKQDSINSIAREKALIEMQEKYNQQKVVNEKNKAEKRGLIILQKTDQKNAKMARPRIGVFLLFSSM